MALLALQFDIPGSPVLYVVGVSTLLAIVLPAYFVYTDATDRNDEHARLWTGATILGGLAGSGIGGTVAGALLVVVLYVIHSGD